MNLIIIIIMNVRKVEIIQCESHYGIIFGKNRKYFVNFDSVKWDH